MAKAPKSPKELKTFDAWFVSQYGKRPSDKPLQALMDDYMMDSLSAGSKKRLYLDCLQYDIGKTVASVALIAKKHNLFKE